MADQPTAEDMQQGAAIAEAGVQAAQAEETPAKARTAARKAVKRAAPASFELTDDQCNMIADRIVDGMESRGAFDPPPPQVQPQPSNDPPAAAAPPSDQPAQAQAPEIPRPKSFAERFRGK